MLVNWFMPITEVYKLDRLAKVWVAAVKSV